MDQIEPGAAIQNLDLIDLLKAAGVIVEPRACYGRNRSVSDLATVKAFFFVKVDTVGGNSAGDTKKVRSIEPVDNLGNELQIGEIAHGSWLLSF